MDNRIDSSFVRETKNQIKFNSQLFDKTSETMPAKFPIRTMSTNKPRRYTNKGPDS